MGSVLSIFDNCRRGKDDSSAENRPAEKTEATEEKAEKQEEKVTQKESKQESQKPGGKRESFTDRFKKRLFSSQSKDKDSNGKERVVIEYKDGDKDEAVQDDIIDEEVLDKEKETKKSSILRKKQTPAPPHDAIRLPQGKLVDPRLAALQGNGKQKPKSTAFENYGQQKAKLQQGEAHKRPMTSGDLVDEEEVFTDEEEPVPGGIAMPGLQELRKRFSDQGTEVKVRRLSSKDRHQEEEAVGDFSSVPRNSALLRRFDRAPPPRRSNARISRMQLRQRVAQEQDLFNSGGWNNNNSSHRNSNRSYSSNEESNRSDQLDDSKRSSKSSDEQVPITECTTKITVNNEESSVSNQPAAARQQLLRKTLDSEKQRPRSFTPGGIRLLPNNAELLRKLPKKTEEKKTEPNTLSPESSQNVQNQNRKSVPVFSNTSESYMQNTSSMGIDSDPSGYAQVRSDMDLTSVTTSSDTTKEIKEQSSESTDTTTDKPYHETAL